MIKISSNQKTWTVTLYLLRFGEPDTNGDVYTKDSINTNSLDSMLIGGRINSYQFDDEGVIITIEAPHA